MLDRINTIPWKDLSHAYGAASDVPDLLKSLTSTDEKVCQEAIYELFGNIWHQGTVYEATFYAIPFLVELLNDTKVICKSEISSLLAAIAKGNGYLEVHARTQEGASSWKSILKKQGLELNKELEREREITNRVRQSAKQHLPLIAPYISDSNPETRSLVASALANYPEFSSTYLPMLETALKNEEDKDVKKDIEDAIKNIGSY